MAEIQTDAQARPQIPPAEQLMQLAGGYTVSAAVHLAARLGIADLLANGPRPVAELASATGSKEDALFRVLRLLASLGVFAEPAPRTFALTPLSEAMRPGVPGGVRDMILWIGNGFHFRLWAELLECVRTGRTCVEIVYGKSAFECMQEMPDVFRDFNTAMTGFSRSLAPAVLDVYDFTGVETIMDVAGGHGYSICEILQRYPRMRGVLFDLPSVVEHPDCRVCALRLDERCRHASGDFFEKIPAGADAYYFQHILHDWDDEPALRILANCRRALDGRANGRLLVVDSVLPQDSRPHRGKFLDLHMMVLPGGRERTEPEWRRLFERGGFRITKIVQTRLPESVIEAKPV